MRIRHVRGRSAHLEAKIDGPARHVGRDVGQPAVVSELIEE